ncbi:odorant receptor 74a-like [Drosophila busckii]|uniref:odorant receptor 74a-like n=1 Tax=Drosophila busckii TaxID=30019 RepID=UPI00083EEB82|nr:odorant receptor 74a-like [Drosophila busckii]
MLYSPRLKDGSLVRLPWPVTLYKYFNHICWPLEDNVSNFYIYLDRCAIYIGFLIFCLHNEVDFHYVIHHRHDLDKMLEGMPTYLILVEIQIRGFQLAFTKQQFKRLLQQFYAQIYVTAQSEPTLYKLIQKQMLAMRLNSINYLLALLNYFMVPVWNIIYHRRDMLYKQVYLFDNTVLYFYIPLLICNYWVGFIIDSMLFGELNVIGELMMHLNARYVLLSRDLQQLAQRCLAKQRHSVNLAVDLQLQLRQLLRRHIALNAFAARMEREFSLRIFFSFSFSTGLLCVLGFKAYTNPFANLVYLVWFAGKFFELLAFGMLGSTLHKTTDDLSTMYYSCGWEQIVYHSPNAQENIKLMKLISRVIQIYSVPVSLTGFKYFRVTLEAVVKIIQGAFSYFAFLKSMR